MIILDKAIVDFHAECYPPLRCNHKAGKYFIQYKNTVTCSDCLDLVKITMTIIDKRSDG